ncbi:MAG: hypothetical protein WC389_18375 [Lutibacter sp.]|jgi:hypothetical protein
MFEKIKKLFGKSKPIFPEYDKYTDEELLELVAKERAEMPIEKLPNGEYIQQIGIAARKLMERRIFDF